MAERAAKAQATKSEQTKPVQDETQIVNQNTQQEISV